MELVAESATCATEPEEEEEEEEEAPDDRCTKRASDDETTSIWEGWASAVVAHNSVCKYKQSQKKLFVCVVVYLLTLQVSLAKLAQL